MERNFINQIELARRWGVSPRTLERWRWVGEGPAFVKLGGKVVYNLAVIEAYEKSQIRNSTSDQGAQAGV